MRVTVICTVLNEGEAITQLMDSLIAQTRQPDEVIIVDGGSKDNTVPTLRRYDDRLPLVVLVEPGANIARGRNLAIELAHGDIIASVDAGIRLNPEWLANLISPLATPSAALSTPPPPQVSAGFFTADARTWFEEALGATTLPSIQEIRPATFLPSSRSVAYTKAAWRSAGGYPEWLDYCEDIVFDLRLRDRCGSCGWAPGAIVHFRPRGSLGSFYRQYYRYARGDGKADLWRRRHAIRYFTYLVAIPSILLLAFTRGPLWLLGLLAGAAAYCRTPYSRLVPKLDAYPTSERLLALGAIPVIRATGDLAKMIGYPAGWIWRLKHWREPAVHWRLGRQAVDQ